MADGFEVRTLTLFQVREVCARQLTEDFPPDEQRPMSMIERLLDLGRYSCFGCFDGEKMTAYAFFASLENNVLLDYFSVEKSLRDRGLGSRFLQALIAGPIREADCALVEVEDPDFAPDPHELENRKRRLRFYLRNGLTDTGVRVTTNHVEYRLLALPVGHVPDGEAVLSLYKSIYRAMPPVKAFAKKIQIEGSIAK